MVEVATIPTVTEKTRAAARYIAWHLHIDLLALAATYEANGLDAATITKAAKALASEAAVVQGQMDAEQEAKRQYHASVNPQPEDVAAMRARLAELEAELAAKK